jgi:hypothetical protein
MAVRTVRAGFSALALAGVAVLAGPATSSWAHAELISSSPADGVSLAALPAAATLTFTDEIDATFVRAAVTTPSGTGTVTATTQGVTVTVPLPAAGPGAYRLVYRVVSADGHPISGELRFTVVGTPTTPTTTPPDASPPGATSVGTAELRASASSSATDAAAAGGNTPVTTPPTSTSAADSGGGVPWLVAGIALVLAAGGGAVIAATRGRRS